MLGAGVVGVATAYYLARAGHRVTVIDRQPEAGRETSFANGGQISASHAEPWANPSTPLMALKWLGRSDAPLLFRLRADPAQWAWTLRFLINCAPGRTRVNTDRALRIALYSRAALAELRDETSIDYDHLSRGILNFYRDEREFEQAVTRAEWLTRQGCDSRGLDASACVALEPALAGAEELLAGGIHYPGDESGDAFKFTQRLAHICAGLGVEFRFGTAIGRLHEQGGRIAGVETGKGMISADSYILALGSYSPLLVKPLGIKLPVYPTKGYSVTLPVESPAKAPQFSLTDEGRKLVYTCLGDRLRVAGTAEFAGYDTSITDSRVRSILTSALKLFPGCGDPAKAEFWAGLRSMTPDGVPVIGITKYSNLILNTGHGTLGWTMACGSGRIVADILSRRDPGIDLNGLGIERFG